MTASVWQGGDLAEAGREQPRSAEADRARSATPRRRRLVLAAVLGAMVLAALLITWGGGPATTSVPLDPDNPTFNGTQALARVLQDRGVDVVVARGRTELARAGVTADTTVVLSTTTALRESTITDLGTLTRPAERLVLVRPERRVLRQLAPEVSQRDAFRQNLVSTCDTADVRPGETLSRSQAEYLLRGSTNACFVTEDYAAYLEIPARGQHAPMVLLGSSDLVTNERVTDADNAGIAIRTLGHSDRLVWYMPELSDSPPTAQEQSEQFFPTWFGPMFLLGTFALVAVFFWRGRRLGRLVTEPLPVVIRAIETTESRGRLYRKARDTSRAAAVLRDATRRRLTAYLGVPPGASDDAVEAAVAGATGQRQEQVRALLRGPVPASDSDLLGLALALSALEKEIHRA